VLVVDEYRTITNSVVQSTPYISFIYNKSHGYILQPFEHHQDMTRNLI